MRSRGRTCSASSARYAPGGRTSTRGSSHVTTHTRPDRWLVVENTQPRPKLLDEVRHALRVRHRSRRTEEAYVHWIKRFIRFHGLRNPDQPGATEVSEFLKHLAVEQHVSASTQSQALSAFVFLYRHVLKTPFDWIDNLERAKKPGRLPVVLTRAEVRRMFDQRR